MQVEVYHNANPRNSMAFGFQPNDILVLVASYEVTCPGENAKPMDDMGVLEDAFERFNIGEDAIAAEYRAKGHRSLSKGDVVVLVEGDERRAYACASIGWDRYDGTLHVDKFRCEKSTCRAPFDSDADRYEHYENTGHLSLYY